MSYLLAMLYGAYLIGVGFNGNAENLMLLVETEKSYIAWIIAIGIFVGLYSYDKTRVVAGPYLGLAIVSFVLLNYSQLSTNAKLFWKFYGL